MQCLVDLGDAGPVSRRWTAARRDERCNLGWTFPALCIQQEQSMKAATGGNEQPSQNALSPDPEGPSSLMDTLHGTLHIGLGLAHFNSEAFHGMSLEWAT